ncbi:DUF3592 domain-containing protein [Granulicoccus sp. GXG6511]|uniref:DUF3592 domain-containing protein n=1 Tax=Granulicoccus sp. GXG6511 TaxID=3381351 RepID=UPI003D7DB704
MNAWVKEPERADFGVRGVRRLLGLGAAAGAGLALIVALVLSVQALMFEFTTAEAIGEVVAVQPVPAGTDQSRRDRHGVTVEYPDRNGQFRRFDDVVGGTAPEKGGEITVRYRMGPPVEARVENRWWLWRPATIAGGVGLVLALFAEEWLRNRRRFASTSR